MLAAAAVGQGADEGRRQGARARVEKEGTGARANGWRGGDKGGAEGQGQGARAQHKAPGTSGKARGTRKEVRGQRHRARPGT